MRGGRGSFLAAVLTLLGACGEEAERAGAEDAFSEELKAIELRREEAEKGYLRGEREARRHEERFVRLWDSMRAGNPFDALRAVPFESLALPRLGEPENLSVYGALRARRKRGVGPKDVMPVEVFHELTRSAEGAGWRIVQSEWHHDSFEPGDAGRGARSVVSFEMHASRERLVERAIVKGKLAVEWTGEEDEGGAPVPGKMEVSSLEVLLAEGAPPFREIAVIDPAALGRPPSCSPLLAEDLDGDGLSELVVVGANLLFRNRGGGRFDREDFLSVPYPAPSDAGVLADFTGDGRTDFVGASERDLRLLLFAGDEEGRFSKAGKACLSAKLGHPQVLTAGDVDGDGDLDLFLGQYRPPYLDGSMPTPFHDANDGYPDLLLLNDGKGNFTDASAEAGLLAKRGRRTYGASFADMDEDGDLDLAVTADFAGLDLYENLGSGRFRDVTAAWAPQRHGFGMSHVFGDVNGDGRGDLYFVGMSSTTARRLDGLGVVREDFAEYAKMRAPMTFGNRLLYGQAGGGFRQAEAAGRVARTGWSWGAAAEDFDNDGDLDLFVANGHLSGKSSRDYCTTYWCHDVYEGNSSANPLLKQFFLKKFEGGIGHSISWNGYEHNQLFLNEGAGEDFLGVGFLLGVAGEFDSRAVLPDDQDGDGRVDLLVVEYDAKTFGQRIHVYRNEWPVKPGEANWVGVRLRGRGAVGAKVTARTEDGRKWSRSFVTGESFAAQKASVVRFGLGKVKELAEVTVRWADGFVTTLENPEVNRYHQARRPGD